ncbi:MULTISPECIES: NAD(P)-dependent oxidoreductase [Burkholderia]|uniref:NAD(P)-dependent oxidoreductase n=1 Tax=Burkholderia TaxID=32008 RepID=UPI00075D9A8E|nr:MULTISPECIES: NAD(P)-dependent oxidoreductase [Burkholderia]AOI82873.1 2-hydroxy-3-oxopropionate reductase [Burkholderia cepacia]KUY99083.1 2-hydroxy-3-oxopropionate reductase [Burkholderia sp. RF7-non_BP1]KUZ01090.1 2-hydroxy-3-oxopropionate reductase [Burkholderia sp. RF7-non_BP4]
MQEQIGFIGLGVMGTPMALNLARSGAPVAVWSRSKDRYAELGAAGACTVEKVVDVFAQCRVVILMLADDDAIDTVLGRHTADFSVRVREHVIVNMGTTSPSYSRALATEIESAAGHYVEAPVSGSRKPAEAGQLVVMLAGAPEDVQEVRNIVKPLCRESIICGAVPSALTMKLAVNLYLITMVTGLAEATHFAQRHGMDLAQFTSVLNNGQMASDISRVKLDKLTTQDFTVQAAITDVLKNSRLVAESARSAGLASPLLDVCHALYGETVALGHGSLDMAAVIRAIEWRTGTVQ